jgi:hypothetical protein
VVPGASAAINNARAVADFDPGIWAVAVGVVGGTE